MDAVAPIHPIRLLHGNDFQRFCSVLLTADDREFQAVRGEGGDLGSDGFAAGQTVVFQAYAPEQFRAHKVREKIVESLTKAADLRLKRLPQLRTFRFLSPVDLTVDQHLFLQQEAKGRGFDSEAWGDSKLLGLLAAVDAVPIKRYSTGVIDRAHRILEDALRLPFDERADVAAELLRSLDEAEIALSQDEVQRRWTEEITRRANRALRGESAGRDADEALASIESKLRDR
jgi:hypothetical protein